MQRWQVAVIPKETAKDVNARITQKIRVQHQKITLRQLGQVEQHPYDNDVSVRAEGSRSSDSLLC